MAKPILLTPNEKLLYDELTESVSRLRVSKSKEAADILTDAALKAHELHKSLEIHGYEPKYHSYIIKSRAVSVDEKEFFNHILPIEDLLAYIQNPDANNEQSDYSIGTEFMFTVYIGKLRRYVQYMLIYGETGWMVSGEYLLHVLDSESVSYPVTVRSLLQDIWKAASGAAERIAKKDIQQALSVIAEWISKCEMSRPRIALPK